MMGGVRWVEETDRWLGGHYNDKVTCYSSVNIKEKFYVE